jgi:hypothetical protein
LGTHFFNDLVESDMVYCAVNPGKEGNVVDREFFDRAENVACLENCDWGGTLSFSRVRRTFHE